MKDYYKKINQKGEVEAGATVKNDITFAILTIAVCVQDPDARH